MIAAPATVAPQGTEIKTEGPTANGHAFGFPQATGPNQSQPMQFSAPRIEGLPAQAQSVTLIGQVNIQMQQ